VDERLLSRRIAAQNYQSVYIQEVREEPRIYELPLLLGRDVLRHFVATFDGKNLTFDLVDP
jgi:hypothetical protein